MNEFYQGVIAAIGMLGGLCAFTYWMFFMMEKRIDLKLDAITKDVHTLVEDFRKEREKTDRLYNQQSERTDRLYEMFIDLLKEGKK